MKLVLGLEIHLHLKTDRKMFCYCDANIYSAEPNTHTCPVCLGLPGALPVPNSDAVRKAQLLGLALGSKLNSKSRFDRKHYHYHDLPKGYQISQYQEPLCVGGVLGIELDRIHLEEDTAKSLHEKGKTLIDFNKSGMPLVEIVTKPEFKSVKDAVTFSKKIQEIVRAIGIGDADMEKGQMRLEANISLRTEADEKAGKLPNYKVEIKNINSFRFMEKAVLAEIKRQEGLFEKGQIPIQENRGYDEDKNTTVSQREKEFAHDYRYFPEPDIPPMEFSTEYFEKLRGEIPELPDQIKGELIKKYKIKESDAEIISSNKEGLALFKSVLAETNDDPQLVANRIINEPMVRTLSVEEFKKLIKESKDLIEDENELGSVAKQVLEENVEAVESFKNGKVEALQFLVGQAMKKTGGKADPATMAEILKKLMEVA